MRLRALPFLWYQLTTSAHEQRKPARADAVILIQDEESAADKHIRDRCKWAFESDSAYHALPREGDVPQESGSASLRADHALPGGTGGP